MSVGKLLCVGIRGCTPGQEILESDLAACRKAGVGGVILFDVDVPTMRQLQQDGVPLPEARRQAERNVRDADQLRELIGHISEQLGPDVFVGVDQEGGRVARLSPARGFAAEPSAHEFAALDDSDQQHAAYQQAQQLADLGFNLNFAPCVDLALEPENEIITQLGRSFGAAPDEVVSCATIVLDAHARVGLSACLKHFPGHGSSRGDTHLGAVDITKTWQPEMEWEPYRRLCQRPGVAVMVAHVLHQGIAGNIPASLSAAFITGQLRDQLGFDGVVMTDSIDMRSVADRYSAEEAAVAAVAAGADMVIDGFNLTGGREHPALGIVDALQEALADGRFPDGKLGLEQRLERLQKLRSQH